MAQIITANSRFPTNKQVPDHAIMDFYNKQAYLGNQFIANTGVVTLADTAEHPLLYLSNPAGGSLSLFNTVRKLFAGDMTNTIVFKIYVNPTTVTSGSSITPGNCRIASSTASIAVSKKSVAAVSNGTLLAAFPIGIGYYPVDADTLLIIDPGNSILITATAAAATSCVVEAVWYEL